MMENRITVPVHMWTIDEEGLKVIRQKEPRFVALYKDEKLSIIEWLDENPTEEKITSLIKKAEAFLKHEYFEK